MEVLNLNHADYQQSVSRIGDEATRNFASQSETWWNRHFSWKSHGCRVLVNSLGEHLSYLFYNVDRYREYMTIHNVFTPEKYRRKGHALHLLDRVFNYQAGREVQRFHLSATPEALGFYAQFPLIYWGVDEIGNYHCDLPLPQNGIGGLSDMIDLQENRELLGNHEAEIFNKVSQNGNHFSPESLHIMEESNSFLGESFRHQALCDILSQQKDNKIRKN